VVNGRVEDESRRQYLETHVRAVADAIERGVDLRGYFVWSLLDNFEWSSGYEKAFRPLLRRLLNAGQDRQEQRRLVRAIDACRPPPARFLSNPGWPGGQRRAPVAR